MAKVSGAREERRAALARLDVLSSLSDRDREALADVARLQRYAKGRVVVTQGAVTEAAFGVVSGRLRVSISRANGNDATLAILGSGEIFGELGLFQDGSRSARVTAIEETLLLIIEKAECLRALERSSAASLALCRLLAARIRQLADHLDEVTAMPVEQRLARKLVVLAERWGEPLAGGVGIGLSLSQRELAELADTSRQSANQCLTKWRRAGIVGSTTKRVVISDLRRLQRCADGERVRS
jgi:CRP-like cAMP-binding protein